MALICSDTFAGGTDEVDIAGRTPDTAGSGTWQTCTSLTAGWFVYSNANRVRGNNASTGGGWRGVYYNVAPASNEHDVEVVVYEFSNSGMIGPAGRFGSDGASGYAVSYNGTDWVLYRITSASANTSLATYAQTLTVGNTYTVKLEIRSSAKKVYIDGVERISSADDTTTSTGYGGMWMRAAAAGSNSTRYHADSASITDLSATGTLSSTLGTTAISATATSTSAAATGSLSATLGATTINATATFVAQPSNGSLGVTLADTTISATATSVVPAGAAGSLAVTLDAITISSTATFVVFVAPVGPTAFDSICEASTATPTEFDSISEEYYGFDSLGEAL